MKTLEQKRDWATKKPAETLPCERCGASAHYTGTSGTGIFEGAAWMRHYHCSHCDEESTQVMIVRDA